MEEADALGRWRSSRVEDGGAGIWRLAVGNIVAHLQMQVPKRAFEKGQVYGGNPATTDNAIGESAVFEVEG